MSERKFEWDEEKNKANIKKHGVSFETALYVFKDEHYIEIYDFEHSIDEDRYIAIGYVRTCPHRIMRTSFRQILPMTALKIFEIHQVFLRIFALSSTKFARKSAHISYVDRF